MRVIALDFILILLFIMKDGLRIMKRLYLRSFEVIDPTAIAWISLGGLRMTLKTKQIMERRFPDSPLLLAEQIMGFDGKLRYPRSIRKELYQKMLTGIRSHSSDVCVYLCMEDEQMNLELGVPVVPDACIDQR